MCFDEHCSVSLAQFSSLLLYGLCHPSSVSPSFFVLWCSFECNVAVILWILVDLPVILPLFKVTVVIVQSQKRKATSSKSLTRQHGGTSTEHAVTWQQEAENVLQMIVDSPDSVPFRSAVNIEEFPVCNQHLFCRFL